MDEEIELKKTLLKQQWNIQSVWRGMRSKSDPQDYLFSHNFKIHLNPIRALKPLVCFRYGTLLELGEKRKDMLEKSCKKFMLFREANELQQWINEKESALTNEEVGSDLEQVEVLQKKFDDFQKVRSTPNASVLLSVQIYLSDAFYFPLNQDLKANESRLRDINKVASELESEGLMAEEAPMVQAQVKHKSINQIFMEFLLLLLLLFINKHILYSVSTSCMRSRKLARIYNNVNLYQLLRKHSSFSGWRVRVNVRPPWRLFSIGRILNC